MAASILAAFRPDRPETLGVREGSHDRYTTAQRQQLLDGVERIATSEQTSRDSRMQAFHILSTIYRDPDIDVPEEAEIPGRVLRIFDRTTSMEARGIALHDLALILSYSPPEAPRILRRMVQVASGVGPPEALAPESGIRALLQSCQPGLAGLRRLADEHLVKDYALAVHVQRLLENGITREMMEAERLGIPCPEAGGR